MDERANAAYELMSLSSADVDEIFALYELCRSATPYGYLAHRAKDDFAAIFADPANVVSSGIRDAGRLIAYSICHRITINPYPDKPLLSDINPTASVVFHGDGTVVHPAYQGRLLAKRMFALRLEQMADRRIDHMLGLVSVENLPSIGNALLSGALLVGFFRTKIAQNYVVYAGSLNVNVRTDAASVMVDFQDRKRQEQLFAERHVMCGLRHRTGTRAKTSRDANYDRRFCLLPIAERQSIDRPDSQQLVGRRSLTSTAHMPLRS